MVVPSSTGLSCACPSIWQTQQAMTDMVHGRSAAPSADRHAKAMQERNRKDFHHEFTTLRFRPISEQGCWQGKERLLPETDEDTHADSK